MELRRGDGYGKIKGQRGPEPTYTRYARFPPLAESTLRAPVPLFMLFKELLMPELSDHPLAVNRFDAAESKIDKSDIYLELLHYNPATSFNTIQGRFVIRKDRALAFAQHLFRLLEKDPHA